MSTEPWRDDDEAFEDHFGLSYLDFCNLIAELPEEKQKRYADIQAKDDEAAITWAIVEAQRLGILRPGDGLDNEE